LGRTPEEALYRAMVAGGLQFPKSGNVIVSVADADKEAVVPPIRSMHRFGYQLHATPGTAAALERAGLPVVRVRKPGDMSVPGDDSVDLFRCLRREDTIMVVNTHTRGEERDRTAFRLRRDAAELGVSCITSLDMLTVFAQVLDYVAQGPALDVLPLASAKTITPGTLSRGLCM